jgi:hypothetical protein
MLVAFALLGTAWSATQVLLLAAVAVGDRRPSRMLWGLIAVETAVVALGLHGSPGEILAVCTIAVLLFAGVVASRERTSGPAALGPMPRAGRRPVRSDPEAGR